MPENPQLVPCLVSLRGEFDQIAPGRDRASDGWIGNPAHAQTSSDHNPDETGRTPSEDTDSTNEVHALDVTKAGSWPRGFSMEKAVQRIVARQKSGADDRLQNVIFNRRIWSRSWGWTERAYTGPNAHTEHAHFGARYTPAQEADTRPWGLLDLVEDDMNAAEMTAWAKSPAGVTVLSGAWLAGAKSKDGRDALFAAWHEGLVGRSGIKSAVMLQNAAGGVVAIQAAASAEAARDAQTAAILAGMQTALSALAAASGVLTPEQVVALTEQVRQAAQAAGAEAVSVLAEQVQSLRDHLGDEAQG